jgi:RecB family endonuclease NucS
MYFQHRRPYRHPERDYEDQLYAYLWTRPGVRSVGRQVPIPGYGIADLCVWTELDDDEIEDGISRVFVVVEVKAQKAGIRALNQLHHYLEGVVARFQADSERIAWAGILAAPSFSPEVEAFIATHEMFGLIRLEQIA